MRTSGSTVTAAARAGVCLLALMFGGCAGLQLKSNVREVRAIAKEARDRGAYKCAPRELALAETHVEFADHELDQGDYFRARDHVRIADRNAREAYNMALRCAPRAPGDRDHDGILDNVDKCPDDPEDKDGFEDEDGCPDLDNDKDGIPDKTDKCPNEPEDKDGFQDDDGCPDPDNDNDGVPDVRDKCPNEPETKNNYQDDDGCPDEIPVEVKKFTGVIEGINYKTGSAEILPGSYAILDRAVKVLQDFPDVNLEISGHTDSRGKADYNRDLSQRRADAVKNYFVSRGVNANRLTSIGYGMDRPIADNRTNSGRARNRRTEFKLISPGER
jgi:OmpA-OmpF porin, OOP family